MQIQDVAKYQKLLLLAVLIQIAAIAVRLWLATAAGSAESDGAATASLSGAMLANLVQLGAAIFGLVVLVLLMGAMDRPIVSKVLAAIAQFLPLIGLIVLLVVNQRATGILKENGYKVGIMGAKST